MIQIFSSTFKYGRNWNRFYIWLIQIDFYQLMLLLLLLLASEKLLYISTVNDVSNLRRWKPTRRNKSLEWFVHAVVDKVLSWKQTIERKTTISKIWPNCIFFSSLGFVYYWNMMCLNDSTWVAYEWVCDAFLEKISSKNIYMCECVFFLVSNHIVSIDASAVPRFRLITM